MVHDVGTLINKRDFLWGLRGEKRSKVLTTFTRQYLFYICWSLLSSSPRPQGSNQPLIRILLGKDLLQGARSANCTGLSLQQPPALISNRRCHLPAHSGAKMWSSLLSLMELPEVMAEACCVCGREQESQIKKNWTVCQSCQATVNGEESTILFIFFHRKQVWEAQAGRGMQLKKERGTTFSFF